MWQEIDSEEWPEDRDELDCRTIATLCPICNHELYFHDGLATCCGKTFYEQSDHDNN